MNSLQIMGRLTRDVELKTIPSGTSIANFSIAFSEKYKDKENLYFFDCVAWGKTGEIIQKYFSKGERILVNGSLQQERWQQDDGKNRSKVAINVRSFDFIEKKTDDVSQGASYLASGGQDVTNEMSGEDPF